MIVIISITEAVKILTAHGMKIAPAHLGQGLNAAHTLSECAYR